MNDLFPSTRRTLVARLRDQANPLRWEQSWQEFFDLYHAAIRTCVKSTLRRQGWHDACAADVDDIVVELMRNLYEPENSPIDVKQYRFRQMLHMLAHRRVVDFIRRRQRQRHERAGENALAAAAKNEALESPTITETPEEAEEFQNAALLTLFDALRKEVSFQVFLIFELVKFKNAPPAQVAEELGVKRSVVDNSVYKAMQKLREIARRPEIQEEFQNHE